VYSRRPPWLIDTKESHAWTPVIPNWN
jgi:hypothetical protein